MSTNVEIELGYPDEVGIRERCWQIWNRAVTVPDPGDNSSKVLIAAMLTSSHIFKMPEDVDYSKGFRVFGPLEERARMLAQSCETYVLPFPVIACHTPGNSMAFMWRLNKDELKKGIKGTSLIAICSDDVGFSGWWITALMMPATIISDGGRKELGSVMMLATVNVQEEAKPDLKYTLNPVEIIAGLNRKDRATKVVWDSDWDKMTDEYMRDHTLATKLMYESFDWAFEFMCHVQQPKQFIVQLAPENKPRPQKKRKNGKRRLLKPLSEMPIYISLQPKEIRRKLEGVSPREGRRPRGHERRAHMRRLTSARFRWKQGQVVPVKGSWVGPVSGTTPEGREYRVLIDKISPVVVGQQQKESAE